jgi:hypothetical protein
VKAEDLTRGGLALGLKERRWWQTKVAAQRSGIGNVGSHCRDRLYGDDTPVASVVSVGVCFSERRTDRPPVPAFRFGCANSQRVRRWSHRPATAKQATCAAAHAPALGEPHAARAAGGRLLECRDRRADGMRQDRLTDVPIGLASRQTDGGAKWTDQRAAG